jgi:hypothetical protein
MDWLVIPIGLLVAWAVYHTFAEMKQDKRIEQLEKNQKDETKF